jgi:hypothetical protein
VLDRSGEPNDGDTESDDADDEDHRGSPLSSLKASLANT